MSAEKDADTPQTPDSAPDQPAPPPGEAEHVDAELVRDGHPAEAPASDDGPYPDAATPPASDAPIAPVAARPFYKSPGVILAAALAVIAAIVFAVWTGAERKPAATAAPAAGSAPQTATPAEAQTPARPAPAPASKIDNAAVAETATAATPPAENLPGETPAKTLPPAPAPSEGANSALQDAAKRAREALASGAGTTPSDDGDAIDLGGAPAPSAETPAFSAPQTDAPGAEDVDAAKIANDVAALKNAAANLAAALGEERAAAREQAAQIADLRGRLDKIQSEGGSPASRQAAASLALLALQRRIDAGEPYGPELDVLDRLLPGVPAVQRLRAASGEGAPTVDALKAAFAPAARQALLVRDGEKGLLSRFENLVSVRPAEPMAGPAPQAVISRAEANVEAGALADAVAELQALDGPAAEAFGPWLGGARARVAADAALEEIAAALLDDFAD